MNSFIHSALRRQRNQRHLTLDDVSAMTRMSPQHLSEIESGKRDPRLSSIERMADAMGLTLLLVPEHMAPDMRRYIATNGRVFVANTNLTAQQSSSQDSAP
jgi:transcriptional regulator with XRE-family HTH domain